MLRGGLRGAMEALYALQAEEATALRADMREVVEELRAHHARYQEMAALRATADHQIIVAVGALVDIAKALELLAIQANSTPEKVQAVLNSADVTELHRKLGEALTVDIWARLGAHSDTEAKRFADIATRIEKNVHAAVQTLRDANAGKPSLPPPSAEGTVTERLRSRARYHYVQLLRLSADLQPLAVSFAGICVGLTAVAVLFLQVLRTSITH